MEIEQVTVRPGQTSVLVTYRDPAKRIGWFKCDKVDPAAVASLVQEAEEWLPEPSEVPDIDDVEKEISRLEGRLADLRRSIGQS